MAPCDTCQAVVCTLSKSFVMAHSDVPIQFASAPNRPTYGRCVQAPGSQKAFVVRYFSTRHLARVRVTRPESCRRVRVKVGTKASHRRSLAKGVPKLTRHPDTRPCVRPITMMVLQRGSAKVSLPSGTRTRIGFIENVCLPSCSALLILLPTVASSLMCLASRHLRL